MEGPTTELVTLNEIPIMIQIGNHHYIFSRTFAVNDTFRIKV